MSRAMRAVFVCAISVSGIQSQSGSGVSGGSNGASMGATAARWSAGAVTAGGTLLTGTVKMDNGLPVPGNIAIEVVCAGSERTVAHTGVSDGFSFPWSNNGLLVGVPTPVGNAYNTLTDNNSDASAIVHGSGPDRSNDCDLRASTGGYTSSVLNLNNPASFNGSDVGVIWLHRIGGHEGNLVSLLTLSAPKDAKKNFDKGTDLVRAGKLSGAQVSFQKAVSIYPKYADAWLSLGTVQFKMGSADDARSSLQKATELDGKLAGAWQVLGYIASAGQNWQDAARYLDRAIELDPMNSPQVWFFSAIANYHLRQYEQAERSIRAEIKMDPQSLNRRAQYVLGLILIANRDVQGGAEQLRDYLAKSPDPRDVGDAKTVLSRLQTFATR